LDIGLVGAWFGLGGWVFWWFLEKCFGIEELSADYLDELGFMTRLGLDKVFENGGFKDPEI